MYGPAPLGKFLYPMMGARSWGEAKSHPLGHTHLECSFFPSELRRKERALGLQGPRFSLFLHVFVHFLEKMFLRLLYVFETISRDPKWLRYIY